MKTAIDIGVVTAREIVKILGGTNAVAVFLGIKPPSVSDWISANSIPDDKLIRLAVVLESTAGSNIKRKDLFPDDWHLIWPELEELNKCVCQ